MWYVEFLEGELTGVSLDLSEPLYLCGKVADTTKRELLIPSVLGPTDYLEIKVNEGKPFFDDTICKENYIYTKKGVTCFFYRQSNREPKLNRYKVNTYLPILVLVILINLALSVSGGYLSYIYNNTKLRESLHSLSSAYIKDGTIFKIGGTKEDIPWHLREYVKQMKDVNATYLTQLSYKVVSKETGQEVASKSNSLENYDQIIVDLNEREINIMMALGSKGIRFAKNEEYWLVENVGEARQILLENKISPMPKLQAFDTNGVLILTRSEFPFDVFYSSSLGGYVYNTHSRFWEGSNIPELGTIESITKSAVIIRGNEGQVKMYKL
jgi:hypothetical protein